MALGRPALRATFATNTEKRKPRPLLRKDSEIMTERSIESMDIELANSEGSMISMLQQHQNSAANEVVPWFLENMPPAYMRQIPPHLREQHLRALTALHGSGASPEITLKSTDGTITLIRSGNYPGQLLGMIEHLPKGRPLESVKVFSAKDETIALNVFSFQNSFTESFSMVPDQLREYTKELQAGKYSGDANHAQAASYFESEPLQDYVRRCQPSYVANSSPRRFCKQMSMYYELLQHGTDDIAIDIEHNWANTDSSMITLAMTNVLPMPALIKVSRKLASLNLDIVRTHLDVIQTPKSEEDGKFIMSDHLLSAEDAEKSMESFCPRSNVTMLRVLVAPYFDEATGNISSVRDNDAVLRTELPRFAKWLGDETIEVAVKHNMSSLQAELVTGLRDLTHAILGPRDPYQFAKTRIMSVLDLPQHFPIVEKIVHLFEKRFNPDNPMDETEYLEQIKNLRKEIAEGVDLTEAKIVLDQMVTIIEGTLRTNAYLTDRYGLMLRIDPTMMMDPNDTQRTEVPYGVFFAHGRRFNGFHVRFRDIARGGLRMVTPPNSELLSIESTRHFNECYDLAFAQQLKNKDIAEGGSKAVCLVDQMGLDGLEDKNHVLRKCVKIFSNNLLDLITENEDDQARVVDRLGKKELVYLGPDEQIIPEDIDWIINRAKQREYIVPSAFMSSKPSAGINHKVYGVTSEGVAVFLDVALEAVHGKISDDNQFTCKITGGPDGDVAGNMLKILERDYGKNAKVVGMADGTGCLEDPEGINMDELLRLFHDSKPLDCFDTAKLGSKGFLKTVDTTEGVHLRNTMHNRVVADAFVPAGGRPATINDGNWEQFLLEDGTPSSKLIVEGANLFLTPQAREYLAKEAGCVVVKDSSANKCGVMCSSYEIMSSMLLSEEEFLDVKEELVEDVLVKLRMLARKEAEYMFREYRRDPTQSLPPVSTEISRAIIRAHDAVSAHLVDFSTAEMDEVMPIAREALPAKLAEIAWDRVPERIPAAYQRELVSSAIGSRLVYDEGVQYVNSIGQDTLASSALKYIGEEKAIHEIIEKLESSSLPEKERRVIASLLRKGGTRAAMDVGGINNI